MLRAALAVLASLLLSACSGWASDERLFSDGDWAHLDIDGRYRSTAGGDETKIRLDLKTRSDGLIEGHSTDRHDTSRTLIGLVGIVGGSGKYFLSVDRSSDDAQGDQYFIVRVSDDKALEYFIPDCAATPPADGMTKVPGWHSESAPHDDATDEIGAAPTERNTTSEPRLVSQVPPDDNLVCKFSTKDALMKAALEAEKFLSAKHIVAVTPFVGLERDDETNQRATKRR